MTKVFCDLCGCETNDVVRVEVLDGEHPHNGSTMYKDIDVCFTCLDKIPLKSMVEFDVLKSKMNFKMKG